jgi:aspartyl protease family protein
MYYVDGRINGTTVQFLVDTGATTVAMNSTVAKRIGLDYRALGTQSIANTAAGQVLTWRLNLDRIAVGGIKLTNVDAAVIEGDFPRSVLLGMSFLKRIKMQDNGLLLTLEQSR